MKRLVLNMLLVSLLFCVGCRKKTTYTNTAEYKPFPNVLITVTICYDHSELQGRENGKHQIRIETLDDAPYRFEFWDGVYRGRDKRTAEIAISSSDTVTRKYENPNGYLPIERIECYTEINGEIRHETVKVESCLHH